MNPNEKLVINPLIHPTVYEELRPLVLEGKGVFVMPAKWLQRRDPIQVDVLTPHLRKGCIILAKQLLKATPYGVHINAHLNPIVQVRVNQLLGFDIPVYNCVHCNVIPEEERYVLPADEEID